MVWTQNGIDWVCQKFGNANQCIVSSGIIYDYKDSRGITYTGQTAGTAVIVGFLTTGIVSWIKVTTPPRNEQLTRLMMTAANTPNDVVMEDAQELALHDETSTDQWCYSSGTARIRCTNCTTTAYDFGTRVINSPSLEHQFTIGNEGYGDANVTATLTGTNATDFQISLALVSPIPEGYGHYVGVKFNPKSSGVKNATLHVVCSNCETGYTLVDQKLTGTGGEGTDCTNPTGTDGEILNCGISPLDTTHKWECTGGTWFDKGYNATCVGTGCTDPDGPVGSEECVDGYTCTCSADKEWVPNVPAETCVLCSSYKTPETCTAGGCFWYSDLPFIGAPYCHNKKEDPTMKYLIYGGIALIGVAVVVMLVKRRGVSQTMYYPPPSESSGKKRQK